MMNPSDNWHTQMSVVIHEFTENDRVRRDRYRGFTLVEVLVALTLLTMAGSALLLTTYSAIDSATSSLDQTIAQGIARQFLDEAMGLAYAEPGSDPFSLQLGPDTEENGDEGRFVSFDDTDDFANYHALPLVDPWGKAMGTGDDQGNLRDPNFRLGTSHFRNWELTSTVVYVDETNPGRTLPEGSTSGLRAIEVSVYKRLGNDPARLLVTMRRIYSYVPSPQ
jgi:prepilin-type N-terminal cleavage/methylation domain-containing protein